MSEGGLLHARQWRGRSYLVSPVVDFMVAGGAAFLFFSSMFLLFPGNRLELQHEIVIFSATFLMLTYFVNHPHFIASYQLLYEDFPAKLREARQTHRRQWLRYLNAGIFVPVIMLLFFAYAFYAQREYIFGYGMYALYFFVGWHYVKQSYGVLIVLSALKKSYFNRGERLILLLNSYLIWANSWLPGRKIDPGVMPQQSFNLGVYYTDLYFPVPSFLIELLYWSLYLYGALCLGMLAFKWWREKQRPSLSGVIGYASMYILLLLAWHHPLWAFAAPMFHSLQYLLFVWAYKRGEADIHRAGHLWTREEAKKHMKRFAAIACLGGALLFYMIPHALEKWLAGSFNMLLLPITFSFTIFLNIHHYFIDNVIWKKENPMVGQYLFHRPDASSRL